MESIPEVFSELFSTITDDVISAAIQENPWFTPYYIQFSQQAICSWFESPSFHSFHSQYLIDRDKPAKEVGIIMAGNIPWVGLHDLLICWLAGHKAIVKPSSQDKVLINWFIQSAVKALPELQDYVEVVDRMPAVDFLLATGSNNSARYFNHHFDQTKKLVRHNRYSVAIVDEDTSPNELKALAKDLFLHNGLGCRNVSNVMISEELDPKILWKIWEDESMDWLNPLYLRKLQMEKAITQMKNPDILAGKAFIAVESSTISSTPMGIFNMIRYKNKATLALQLEAEKENIQCIVGKEIAFGRTQIPDIGDFADDIDSLSLLNSL